MLSSAAPQLVMQPTLASMDGDGTLPAPFCAPLSPLRGPLLGTDPPAAAVPHTASLELHVSWTLPAALAAVSPSRAATLPTLRRQLLRKQDGARAGRA